jgi:tetratricopeptide (TPR) repeat protein
VEIMAIRAELAQKRSEYVKAIMDRALALFQAGKLESAEILFNEVAGEPAVRPLVQHMRGVIAHHLGDEERAQDLLEEAVRLNPEDGEAHANLGLVLLTGRQYPTALAAYAAGLTLLPDNVAAHFGLAKSLTMLGLPEFAYDAFRDVFARAPDYVQGLLDFASLLNELGRQDEAVATLRDVLARQPQHTVLDAALTGAMFFPTVDRSDNTDGHAEAIAAFRDALARHPDQMELHMMLAFCLFAVGDWSAAWAEYEWRLKDPEVAAKKAKEKNRVVRPRWRGEDLAGRTILLQNEQGYGDVLQFARYAPMVKARGASVVLRAQESLLPVLRSR